MESTDEIIDIIKNRLPKVVNLVEPPPFSVHGYNSVDYIITSIERDPSDDFVKVKFVTTSFNGEFVWYFRV
jgi:hypothetical protein